MVREGVILGEKGGFEDPRTRAFVGKAVHAHACHFTVSFSHCCHSHCCRTFLAPMSHRTAGIRTSISDIRTLVSIALLTLSHCWHSHCWLRTGVVRTFVFRTLVVQAVVSGCDRCETEMAKQAEDKKKKKKKTKRSRREHGSVLRTA